MYNIVIIRNYKTVDAQHLANIYCLTIRNINKRDYSQDQLNAWAPLSILETESWIKKWKKIVWQIIGLSEASHFFK